MKTKLPLTLIFTLFIFHAFARDPERDLKQCEQRCQRQQTYFEEHLCRQRCEREVSEKGGQLHDRVRRVGDAEEEYERCQQHCPGIGPGQWQCQRWCQNRYEAALEREREEGHHEQEHEHEDEDKRTHEHEHKHGGGDRHPREDQYMDCIHNCDDREEGFPRQRQCRLDCEEKYGSPDRHHARDYANDHHKKRKKGSDNPYYFYSDCFEIRFSTQQGRMRVLKRFSENSDLLSRIDRFRVGLYEANPHTFMLPHHCDADSVLFMIRGKAIMKFVSEGNQETFDLERGDVLVVRAGTTAYLVSSHDNEKLEIAELLHPVNIRGHYEQFFGIGGGENESFYDGFSKEVLEASLDLPSKQLKRRFEQQEEGAVVEASQEQVRALSQHRMSRSRREMGDQSQGPFKLLDEGHKFSNEHGEFFQVSPNDYQQLEDLDVSLAHCNMQQGSMMAPHYNWRTTYILMVEEGSGYIEMSCPHMGNQHNENEETKHKGSIRYKKVKSNLSKGDVFVVPAGHPIALVAAETENLTILGFGINARSNQMNFLAGKGNIINEFDREAKELSFGMRATEVDEMFRRQKIPLHARSTEKAECLGLNLEFLRVLRNSHHLY